MQMNRKRNARGPAGASRSWRTDSPNVEVNPTDTGDDAPDTVTAGSNVPEGEPSETVTEEEIEAAEAKTAEMLVEFNDRYLRLMAEFDNFRKRTIREREEIATSAAGDLAREIIPILDNLDRATEHRNDATTFEDYVKGIALIEDQLRQVLARAGLEVIEAKGQPFNPEIHDAIMQVEAAGLESGTVADVAEKGYRFRGKVLRHPKVIVAK